MDFEKQAQNLKTEFSFQALKEHLKERAYHPSINATLVIFLILNLVMLVMGLWHMNDCPIRKMVPVYLIVAGAVGIVSKALPFINKKLEMKLITVTLYVLYVFEFVWMILGSYWVYSINRPNFDKAWPLYCDRVAYYLAFWLLTVNWILIATTLVLTACAAVVATFVMRK